MQINLKDNAAIARQIQRVDHVHREIARLEKEIQQVCKTDGLNILDYVIMIELNERGSSSKRTNEEIATALHVSAALFSIRIKRLLSLELIEIRSDSRDRRIHRVTLTRTGRKYITDTTLTISQTMDLDYEWARLQGCLEDA